MGHWIPPRLLIALRGRSKATRNAPITTRLEAKNLHGISHEGLTGLGTSYFLRRGCSVHGSGAAS